MKPNPLCGARPLAVLAWACLLFSAQAEIPPGFAFVAVPRFDNSESAWPTDINEAGDIVGNTNYLVPSSGTLPNFRSEGFLFIGNALTRIDDSETVYYANIYPLQSVGYSSRAMAINNSGEVVGSIFGQSGSGSFHLTMPWMVSSLGNGALLGEPYIDRVEISGAWPFDVRRDTEGRRYLAHTAMDINDNGSVLLDDSFGSCAIWRDGEFEALGDFSEVTTINNSDWVGGIQSEWDEENEVWRHHAAIRPAGLAATPIDSSLERNSFLTDLNNSGHAVGYFMYLATGQNRAFTYVNGTLSELGHLPGHENSQSFGMNDAGDVVGASYNEPNYLDENTRGFLYSDGQMVDLNDFIPSNSGWTILLGIGINNQGQIAAVASYMGGKWQTVRLDPLARGINVTGDLNFGDVEAKTSQQRILTIHNTSEFPITVTSISYPAGFSGPWSGTIAAGGSREVAVKFSPSSAGGKFLLFGQYWVETDYTEYSGEVVVNTNAEGLNTIPIEGRGIKPLSRVIGLSGDLSYGNLLVGTSEERNLTITNTGTGPMTVTSISYPTGFFGENWSGIIAPSESKVIAVTFQPNSKKIFRGNISVISNKTSGLGTYALQGAGVLPINPEIDVHHPPGTSLPAENAQILFGNVPTGFNSPVATLTIQNVGTESLTISEISLEGTSSADFSLKTPHLPIILASTRKAVLGVTFSPRTQGTQAATLRIISNDTDESPFEINLTGTGTSPDYQFATGEMVSSDLPGWIDGTVSSVRGLPSGMKYDASGGKLIGRPKGPGTWRAAVVVIGGEGTRQTHLISIVVEALPDWVVGSFTALMEPPRPVENAANGLGGWLTLGGNQSGVFAGKFVLGTKSYPFRGQVEGVPDEQRGTNPLESKVVILVDRRDPAKNIELNFEFRPESDSVAPGLTGSYTMNGTEYPIGPGWKHVWNGRTNPAFGGRDRILNLFFENTDADSLQGHGFARVKLTKAGLAMWAGTLSDGAKVTGSFTVSPDAEIPLYVPIRYPAGGAIFALLATENVGSLLRVFDDGLAEGRWIKQPTPSNKPDRLLPEGFDSDLEIRGAEYLSPGRDEYFFGNAAPTTPLTMVFEGGGIESSVQLGGLDPADLAVELQLRNTLVLIEQGLPVRFVPALATSTGLFGGKVGLKDPSPLDGKTIARTLTFNGLYIPDFDDPSNSSVRGFFLLPELPDEPGEMSAKTPIQSGNIRLGR